MPAKLTNLIAEAYRALALDVPYYRAEIHGDVLVLHLYGHNRPVTWQHPTPGPGATVVQSGAQRRRTGNRLDPAPVPDEPLLEDGQPISEGPGELPSLRMRSGQASQVAAPVPEPISPPRTRSRRTAA